MFENQGLSEIFINIFDNTKIKWGDVIMKKRLILLTKSRKKGGYCTAGIDTENGKWIRIVSDGKDCNGDEMLDEHLRYDNGGMAQILDIIEVECIEHNPNYYQPENYVFDSSTKMHKIGSTTIDKVLEVHPFENKDTIFYDTSYSIPGDFIKKIAPNDKYSLILIKVTNPQVDVKTWENGSKSVTLNFSYNFKSYKYFRITDGLESGYKGKPDDIYTLPGDYAFVISLGELWDNKHYKLVSKIFSI
jgi:hypothetical protein